MKSRARRYQFDNPAPEGVIRLRSAKLAASKDTQPGDRTVINLARVVKFRDHFYGKVELSPALFNKMIDNFKANTYGQEIYIDVSHNPGEGAAATIKRLFLEGTRFRAEVEWTEYGIDAVKKRGFRYLSIDFTENYVDPEDRDEKPLGAVLFGAALTTRPRVKHLDPVQLSGDEVDDPDAIPSGTTPQFKQLLFNEINTMEKYLKWLKKQLAKTALSEDIQTQLCDAFEKGAAGIEDDTTLKTLAEQLEKTGKQLAEGGEGPQTVQLKIETPGKQLSEDDINRMLDERQKEKDDAAKAAETTLAERLEQYDNLMDAAFDAEKGQLRSLSEKDQEELRGSRDLITADMSEDQVKRLAETQITIGDRMVVATKLAERGYQQPGGQVQVSAGDENEINRYQETINENLRGTTRFAEGSLQLSEETHPFVGRVLSMFDAEFARELHTEGQVMLAGSETDMSNTDLPFGVQRTVIREALSDMRVLELIQTLTDPGAQATTQIPYETRDTSAIRNGGVVYEGQGIHRAGIKQAMDMAYIVPMKLAMIVTNEVAHFSRASAINWDAWARNVAMNARVMRELVVTRICNALQRASDNYMSASVVDESVTVNATTRVFKTANFPIIRAHQTRDLAGNAVGSPENVIEVKVGGSAIAEFDGSGDQATAVYYRVTNYNLGFVQIVDETGSPVAPGGAVTCSYDWSSNVVKIDTDLGSATLGERWNDVLVAFGARKAILAQERYITPNFALMAHTLNDAISNADNFIAQNKKNGTDLTGAGDLQTIKSVPGFSTNAPGIDLGEERALMGQRGTLSYVVAKPFRTGKPFEAVDSNGLPTGEKQAYGEEYSAIHVPAPLRGYMTSLIAYSANGRAAV